MFIPYMDLLFRTSCDLTFNASIDGMFIKIFIGIRFHAYLIFMRTMKKHTLGHEKGNHRISPEGHDVRPHYRQHFRYEAVDEAAETTGLRTGKK